MPLRFGVFNPVRVELRRPRAEFIIAWVEGRKAEGSAEGPGPWNEGTASTKGAGQGSERR